MPLPKLYRLHTFKLNLDRDRAKESVQVFDLHQGQTATPTTYFRVRDRRKGAIVYPQITQVFRSPGSRTSGLVQAWARNLNADRRVEIAVRDYATASVGEVLTLYRQQKVRSLAFVELQKVVGDRIVISRRKAPVRWKILIKANHAPDGRDHHELWRWSSVKKKWVCKTDCVPR